MKLIGIAGTNGAGKDSVGLILAENGWLFISVTEMLREECRTRDLPVERENLRMISAEWRREGGLGVLIDKALEVYNQQGGDERSAGLAVASLRNPGENDRVHELGGKVIWVDADPKVRYDRIRSANRGRVSEDDKTFEQFLAEEAAEMKSLGDSATLNMQAVKTTSDTIIYNESTPEDFRKLLIKVL